MSQYTTGIKVSVVSAPLSSINKEGISEGNIYFSPTGELFYDWGTDRIQITDISKVDTSTAYESLDKTEGKLYFVKDTHSLYYFDGDSYLLTNMPTIEAHIADKISHVTQSERDLWNAKTTLDIDVTNGEVNKETLKFIK